MEENIRDLMVMNKENKAITAVRVELWGRVGGHGSLVVDLRVLCREGQVSYSASIIAHLGKRLEGTNPLRCKTWELTMKLNSSIQILHLTMNSGSLYLPSRYKKAPPSRAMEKLGTCVLDTLDSRVP